MVTFLRTIFFAGLKAPPGVVDGHFRQALPGFGVVVQPQGKCVFDHPVDKGGALARRKALLGLPGKLGVGHLGREHIRAAVPDVVRGQFDATGNQFAEFAEFADSGQQAGAEPVHVGAALGGGDQVDVAFRNGVAALGQPCHGPGYRLSVAVQLAHEGFVRDGFNFLKTVGQVFLQAVFVEPGFFFAFVFVAEGYRQARAQHRLGPQGVAQAPDGKTDRVEIDRIGPEADGSAGVALAYLAGDFQLLLHVTVGKADEVLVPIPFDFHLQPGGEGVDHRHADTVQAAGKLVVLVGKFGPGMQLEQNHLHAGDAFFRVDVRGHAATVVGHAQGTVGVQDHVDAFGETGNGLVHAIVDDLLGQMVGTLGIGVHARTPAHRVQSLEDLQRGGVVVALVVAVIEKGCGFNGYLRLTIVLFREHRTSNAER